MHPSVVRVAEALAASGARGTLVELEVSARTAGEAAALIGCPIGAIVKSLVLLADATPFLLLASGAGRADLDFLARRMSARRVTLAPPELVRAKTGFAIGGVAPVGHREPLSTLIDETLSGYSPLWAAAGHPRAVFPTTFDELVRITGATSLAVAPPRVTPSHIPLADPGEGREPGTGRAAGAASA